jgi:imidazolonepropionase-like amidohydrolase
LVGTLDAARVPLLAGTDAPLRNSIAGFGLHDELAYCVQAGLTPMRALRAATYEPARYLNALDSLGTIEPGRVADLVLLDANPLADIRNTRRIAAVVTRAHVYDSRDRRACSTQLNAPPRTSPADAGRLRPPNTSWRCVYLKS